MIEIIEFITNPDGTGILTVMIITIISCTIGCALTTWWERRKKPKRGKKKC